MGICGYQTIPGVGHLFIMDVGRVTAIMDGYDSGYRMGTSLGIVAFRK